MTKKKILLDDFATIARQLAIAGVVTSGSLARELGVSRQSAHAHLAHAVANGVLQRVGAGRGARYVAPTLHVQAPAKGLDEESIWDELEPALVARFELSPQARERAHYVVTEIVNNAIDHADASTVQVDVSRVEGGVQIVVTDDGVGAIARARRGLDVHSDVEVIAELSKGKRTTAPSRHSGEGLFFTSKTARKLKLEANGLAWIVDTGLDDEGVATSDVVRGTKVTLVLDPLSREPLARVFERYTDDVAFTKTRVRIKLLDVSDELMSRSQGKRVVARLEEFKDVELDFRGVRGVGQGFVDEVFRVWGKAHPSTRLTSTGMNEAVRFMVERGLRPYSGLQEG